jgi:hypothetical protein
LSRMNFAERLIYKLCTFLQLVAFSKNLIDLCTIKACKYLEPHWCLLLHFLSLQSLVLSCPLALLW